jgi:hypothetical protein
MPQDPDVREAAQRDEWFVWDAHNRRRVVVDELEAWPLERAKAIAAPLGAGHLVLHALTWVNEADHKRWAEATDFGARPGSMTMPP